MACESSNHIRNPEFRKADAAGRATLEGSTYMFLKNWGNPRYEQRVRLNDLPAMNARLNTVYWLKDLLTHLWKDQRLGCARATLARWCDVARQASHPTPARFARTLERYEDGILNHCKHPMYTSRLESVNNRIKVIKRIAYGFHDLDYFALRVKQAFPARLSSS